MDNQEYLTPKVTRPPTMDFPEAMRQVINGKKITRIEWNNTDYGVLKDGWLSIYKDKFYTWSVNDGDLLATDWVVVDD